MFIFSVLARKCAAVSIFAPLNSKLKGDNCYPFLIPCNFLCIFAKMCKSDVTNTVKRLSYLCARENNDNLDNVSDGDLQK